MKRGLAMFTGFVLAAAATGAGARADEPPAWHRRPQGEPMLRAWLAPTLALLPAEGLTYAGASAAIGLESLFPVHPAVNQLFYGSAFGLELRVHGMSSVDGMPRSWLLATGLGFSGHITGDSGSDVLNRIRVPSVFALIVPEAGVALRDRQPNAFYLRWSAPVAVLVDDQFAIELLPAVSLLHQSPTGAVEVLWQIGVAVSWRYLKPTIEPEPE